MNAFSVCSNVLKDRFDFRYFIPFIIYKIHIIQDNAKSIYYSSAVKFRKLKCQSITLQRIRFIKVFKSPYGGGR